MNALEKVVKELLEVGYTTEEIIKTLKEMTKGTNSHTNAKTDDE